MGVRRKALGGALGLVLLAGGAVAQEGTTTQESPLATKPLPAEGAGQAAMGEAVTGSAPAPGQPSTMDNAQQQGGVTLKPGAGADDMGAAAGAEPAEPAKQP